MSIGNAASLPAGATGPAGVPVKTDPKNPYIINYTLTLAAGWTCTSDLSAAEKSANRFSVEFDSLPLHSGSFDRYARIDIDNLIIDDSHEYEFDFEERATATSPISNSTKCVLTATAPAKPYYDLWKVSLEIDGTVTEKELAKIGDPAPRSVVLSLTTTKAMATVTVRGKSYDTTNRPPWYLRFSYSIRCTTTLTYEPTCVCRHRDGRKHYFLSCASDPTALVATFQGGVMYLNGSIPFNQLGSVLTEYYTKGGIKQVPFFMIGQGPTFADFEEARKRCVPWEEKIVNISLGPTFFNPHELAVIKGTQVCWKNDDDRQHAISISGPTTPLPVIPPLSPGAVHCIPTLSVGTYTITSGPAISNITITSRSADATFFVGKTIVPEYGMVQQGQKVFLNLSDRLAHNISIPGIIEKIQLNITNRSKNITLQNLGIYKIRDDTTNITASFAVISPSNIFSLTAIGFSPNYILLPEGDEVCFDSTLDAIITTYIKDEAGRWLELLEKPVTPAVRCCHKELAAGEYRACRSGALTCAVTPGYEVFSPTCAVQGEKCNATAVGTPSITSYCRAGWAYNSTHGVCCPIGRIYDTTTGNCTAVGLVPVKAESPTNYAAVNYFCTNDCRNKVTARGVNCSAAAAGCTATLINSTYACTGEKACLNETFFTIVPRPRATIAIEKMGFEPSEITSDPGTRICWQNPVPFYRTINVSTVGLIGIGPLDEDCTTLFTQDGIYNASFIPDFGVYAWLKITKKKTHYIDVTAYGFKPLSLYVKPQDKVCWLNVDKKVHNITDERGVVHTLAPGMTRCLEPPLPNLNFFTARHDVANVTSVVVVSDVTAIFIIPLGIYPQIVSARVGETILIKNFLASEATFATYKDISASNTTLSPDSIAAITPAVLYIRNTDKQPHNFVLKGPSTGSFAIGAGENKTLLLPAQGTYILNDTTINSTTTVKIYTIDGVAPLDAVGAKASRSYITRPEHVGYYQIIETSRNTQFTIVIYQAAAEEAQMPITLNETMDIPVQVIGSYVPSHILKKAREYAHRGLVPTFIPDFGDLDVIIRGSAFSVDELNVTGSTVTFKNIDKIDHKLKINITRFVPNCTTRNASLFECRYAPERRICQAKLKDASAVCQGPNQILDRCENKTAGIECSANLQQGKCQYKVRQKVPQMYTVDQLAGTCTVKPPYTNYLTANPYISKCSAAICSYGSWNPASGKCEYAATPKEDKWYFTGNRVCHKDLVENCISWCHNQGYTYLDADHYDIELVRCNGLAYHYCKAKCKCRSYTCPRGGSIIRPGVCGLAPIEWQQSEALCTTDKKSCKTNASYSDFSPSCAISAGTCTGISSTIKSYCAQGTYNTSSGKCEWNVTTPSTEYVDEWHLTGDEVCHKDLERHCRNWCAARGYTYLNNDHYDIKGWSRCNGLSYHKCKAKCKCRRFYTTYTTTWYSADPVNDAILDKYCTNACTTKSGALPGVSCSLNTETGGACKANIKSPAYFCYFDPVEVTSCASKPGLAESIQCRPAKTAGSTIYNTCEFRIINPFSPALCDLAASCKSNYPGIISCSKIWDCSILPTTNKICPNGDIYCSGICKEWINYSYSLKPSITAFDDIRRALKQFDLNPFNMVAKCGILDGGTCKLVSYGANQPCFFQNEYLNDFTESYCEKYIATVGSMVAPVSGDCGTPMMISPGVFQITIPAGKSCNLTIETHAKYSVTDVTKPEVGNFTMIINGIAADVDFFVGYLNMSPDIAQIPSGAYVEFENWDTHKKELNFISNIIYPAYAGQYVAMSKEELVTIINDTLTRAGLTTKTVTIHGTNYVISRTPAGALLINGAAATGQEKGVLELIAWEIQRPAEPVVAISENITISNYTPATGPGFGIWGPPGVGNTTIQIEGTPTRAFLDLVAQPSRLKLDLDWFGFAGPLGRVSSAAIPLGGEICIKTTDITRVINVYSDNKLIQSGSALTSQPSAAEVCRPTFTCTTPSEAIGQYECDGAVNTTSPYCKFRIVNTTLACNETFGPTCEPKPEHPDLMCACSDPQCASCVYKALSPGLCNVCAPKMSMPPTLSCYGNITTGCSFHAWNKTEVTNEFCTAANAVITCPTNYEYKSTGDFVGKCVNISVCPSGTPTYKSEIDMCVKEEVCTAQNKKDAQCAKGALNTTLDKCIADPPAALDITCPTPYESDGNYSRPRCVRSWCGHYGFNYDSTHELCHATHTCTYGSLNTEVDKCLLSCVQSPSPCCPPTHPIYNTTADNCTNTTHTVPAACPDGAGTLNTNADRCEISPTCSAPLTYNSVRNRCEGSPACPTPNPSKISLDTTEQELALPRINNTCRTYPIKAASTVGSCIEGYSITDLGPLPDDPAEGLVNLRCVGNPICPDGYAYNTSLDWCCPVAVAAPAPPCPSVNELVWPPPIKGQSDSSIACYVDPKVSGAFSPNLFKEMKCIRGSLAKGEGKFAYAIPPSSQPYDFIEKKRTEGVGQYISVGQSCAEYYDAAKIGAFQMTEPKYNPATGKCEWWEFSDAALSGEEHIATFDSARWGDCCLRGWGCWIADARGLCEGAIVRRKFMPTTPLGWFFPGSVKWMLYNNYNVTQTFDFDTVKIIASQLYSRTECKPHECGCGPFKAEEGKEHCYAKTCNSSYPYYAFVGGVLKCATLVSGNPDTGCEILDEYKGKVIATTVGPDCIVTLNTSAVKCESAEECPCAPWAKSALYPTPNIQCAYRPEVPGTVGGGVLVKNEWSADSPVRFCNKKYGFRCLPKSGYEGVTCGIGTVAGTPKCVASADWLEDRPRDACLKCPSGFAYDAQQNNCYNVTNAFHKVVVESITAAPCPTGFFNDSEFRRCSLAQTGCEAAVPNVECGVNAQGNCTVINFTPEFCWRPEKEGEYILEDARTFKRIQLKVFKDVLKASLYKSDIRPSRAVTSPNSSVCFISSDGLVHKVEIEPPVGIGIFPYNLTFGDWYNCTNFPAASSVYYTVRVADPPPGLPRASATVLTATDDRSVDVRYKLFEPDTEVWPAIMRPNKTLRFVNKDSTSRAICRVYPLLRTVEFERENGVNSVSRIIPTDSLTIKTGSFSCPAGRGIAGEEVNLSFTIPAGLMMSAQIIYSFNDNGYIAINGNWSAVPASETALRDCATAPGDYYSEPVSKVISLVAGAQNNITLRICSCNGKNGTRIKIVYEYVPETPSCVGIPTYNILPGSELHFANLDVDRYTFWNDLFGKPFTVVVKHCSGSDVSAIASVLGSYEIPKYADIRCETGNWSECAVYNPYGKVTPAIVTSELGLNMSNISDRVCALGQVNVIKGLCPNCTSTLFVGGQINESTLRDVLWASRVPKTPVECTSKDPNVECDEKPPLNETCQAKLLADCKINYTLLKCDPKPQFPGIECKIDETNISKCVVRSPSPFLFDVEEIACGAAVTCTPKAQGISCSPIRGIGCNVTLTNYLDTKGEFCISGPMPGTCALTSYGSAVGASCTRVGGYCRVSAAKTITDPKDVEALCDYSFSCTPKYSGVTCEAYDPFCAAKLTINQWTDGTAFCNRTAQFKCDLVPEYAAFATAGPAGGSPCIKDTALEKCNVSSDWIDDDGKFCRRKIITNINLIAHSMRLDENAQCSFDDVMQNVINLSKIGLYEASAPSIILDAGAKAEGCWTNATIKRAYDDFFDLWIPQLADAGVIGVAQYCLKDPCPKRDYYGLYTAWMGKKNWTDAWLLEGCGNYYYRAEGLTPLTFPMAETEIALCNPGKMMALLQQLRCFAEQAGITKFR